MLIYGIDYWLHPRALVTMLFLILPDCHNNGGQAGVFHGDSGGGAGGGGGEISLHPHPPGQTGPVWCCHLLPRSGCSPEWTNQIKGKASRAPPVMVGLTL